MSKFARQRKQVRGEFAHVGEVIPCRTQLRGVSGVLPTFSAIDLIAAHCDPRYCCCPNTSRTPLSNLYRSLFSRLHPLKIEASGLPGDLA